jgi:hypothetical protein
VLPDRPEDHLRTGVVLTMRKVSSQRFMIVKKRSIDRLRAHEPLRVQEQRSGEGEHGLVELCAPHLLTSRRDLFRILLGGTPRNECEQPSLGAKAGIDPYCAVA